MLRDQTERTMDMEVLDKVPMEDLNYDTIHGYRNSHRSLKEGHPFERLSDHEYLRNIGAAAISEEDGKLHPTAAGMLMFGDEYNIVRHFPEYFLDYREELDPTTRWSDRLQSSSGEWSGNVCDFYFRVYNKIIKDINSQLKDDTKDPKLIANLVKDGNFGMPYLPEQLYADLRRLSMFRDQLNEDRIRSINRLHRELKIYFPEYKEALGKTEGTFSLELLKQAPFPDDLAALKEDGIRQIWHNAKLRGRGYSRAGEILEYAKASVGIREGKETGKLVVQWFVQKILELDAELALIETQINQKCLEIPHTDKVLEICGIGENTLSGMVAEMGDISRFDDVKEIQKLSGLGLVASSSGKHKGETRISHRGRKRLRYWLFQAAKSAVAHAEEFKKLHVYYTTREQNPLKKMQSLIAIACKLLRIIFTILKKGIKYDPRKMLKDIRRESRQESLAA